MQHADAHAVPDELGYVAKCAEEVLHCRSTASCGAAVISTAITTLQVARWQRLIDEWQSSTQSREACATQAKTLGIYMQSAVGLFASHSNHRSCAMRVTDCK